MYMSEESANSPPLTDAEWERLARYVAGESGPSETADVHSWVASDPDRARFAELLRTETSASSNVITDRDVEIALGKVKARMRGPSVLRFERRPKRIWESPALRIAAGIIIVTGAALLLRNGSSGILNPGVAERFTTPIGEEREIHLRDGTTVLLAPQSRLELAATFGSGSRAVTLKGGAYFDVHHDPARPFSVTMGSVNVRDVGTSFILRQVDTVIHLAVETGTVDVKSSTSSGMKEALITAGGHALIGAGAIAVECCSPNEQDIAWAKGKLIFREAPLSEVSTEVYRWYGVRIQAGDSLVARKHITASFSGEPVNEVLRVIALTVGASVERQGDLAIFRTGASPAPRQ